MSIYSSDIQLLHKSPYTFITLLEKGEIWQAIPFNCVNWKQSLLKAAKNCSGTREWSDGQTGYLDEVCLKLGGKLVSHCKICQSAFTSSSPPDWHEEVRRWRPPSGLLLTLMLFSAGCGRVTSPKVMLSGPLGRSPCCPSEYDEPGGWSDWWYIQGDGCKEQMPPLMDEPESVWNRASRRRWTVRTKGKVARPSSFSASLFLLSHSLFLFTSVVLSYMLVSPGIKCLD